MNTSDETPVTNTTADPEQASNLTTDPTNSFLLNFAIGFATFFIFLIFYDLLRYFFPGHCYYRSTAAPNPANNNYDGTPLQSPPRPSPNPFSWVIPTLRYPFDRLVETHGLDAAMYLRFLQTQARIFLALTIYSSLVLIPTYVTAKIDPNVVNPPSGLEKATLVNVPDKSSRLWVTLASEIAVLAIVLIFLYRDIVKYTEYRLRYRADNKRNPSNFAALVMDVPLQSRDQNYLFNVFNSIFPGQVVAVHPVRDAHHLLNIKMSYIAAVNKRQRAEQSTGPSNSPKSSPPDIDPPGINLAAAASSNIDSPDLNPQLPPTVNDDSEKPRLSSYINTPDVDRSVPNERPLDPHHVDSQVGHDLAKAVTISPTPKQLFPCEELSVSRLTGQPSSPGRFLSTTGSLPKKEFTATDETKQQHSRQFSESSDLPGGVQAPSLRLRALTRPDSNDIVQYDRQASQIRAVLADVEKDLDQYAPVTHAAFIVFRSRVATTCAVSTPIFPSLAGKCKVVRAPDPRAINWNRFNISRYTTRIREYISFTVLTSVTILWAIPSSFIQGLKSLSTLGDAFKLDGIESFVQNYPGFARFLEGVLPPVLLFLVLLIVPQVFRFIVSFERIPSAVSRENKVRNFLFFFYVMSNFVYQVSIGSFLSVLERITENPREILSFLSASVPRQHIFLVKYVLINSFLGSVFGILNMGRLLFRPLVISRAKTERDRIFADRLFADYPFAKMYALCMMISLISYVYSTIAPIMNAVALLYFCLAYLCSKQLLLYSHRPMFEGGGYLFRDAWTGLLIGLYVHQLSMIGIFSLKKATIQATLTAITLAFSVWFTVMCRLRFLPKIEYGSLLNQTPTDEEMGINDEIPKKFINMYIHPGLKPIEILENTEMDPATASLQRRESWRHSHHAASSALMLGIDSLDVIDVS